MMNAFGPTREHSIYIRISCALACALLVAAPASAGWLDKLKESFGSNSQSTEALSTDEIGRGLKDALKVGTETVVSNLGKTDGFNLDPDIHIPLPVELEKVKDILGKVGMDSMLVDLELRLNRAAEIATPKAKALFLQSINDMTLDDVVAIYKGPDNAATEYFKSKMAGPLSIEMQPMADQSLSEAGAVNKFNDVMARYKAIPFAPEVDADLSKYVVEKGMDGIFYRLSQEEAAIRQNPAKRTTDLLKQVFGGNR